MDLIQKTGKIGVKNAVLLDLESGYLNSQNTNIVLDKELINQIKFVKEGHFTETGGNPTLKLIGEIEGVIPTEVITTTTSARRLKAIEPEDIIRSFLKNEDTDSPIEYIKVAFNCSSGFQPIYYFIDIANIEVKTVISRITEKGRQSQTIRIIKERLEGRREKYKELRDTGSDAYKGKRKYLDIWKNFKISEVEFDKLENLELSWLLNAFYSISNEFLIQNQSRLKQELLRMFDLFFYKASGNIGGDFRRIVCRLDEVIYFDKLL
ncbi:MAG: hypothetical protein Q4Q07_04435 [Tissierellia bacterium]|nr:hypothetical protein [Tissierellia bacterium]